MGMFDFLKSEKRATNNSQETISTESTANEPFSLDGLFSTTAITEEKIMKIPTAQACVNLISGTIAQMPVYLYKENADGSIENVNDKRLKLLNHEANDFLNGNTLKRNMVKDYVLHGASYVSIVEAGNTILELHPLPARSIVVNKKVANGYRTVGAEIVLSTSEGGAYNTVSRKPVVFKPYELMIAIQESHDGLTSKGVLKHGENLFKQALAEMEYTQNLYERGALPLGLLKTEGRMTENQVNSLRDAWKNLYGGVKNSAKTVVLQEGMDYQALSMNPNEIQMNDTKKATSSEICKLFGVPEGLINPNAGSYYTSIEQNSLHFLKHALAPIVTAIEAAMDRALLLESEKDSGYFFRFDTSEIARATEKERVETAVRGIQGGLFTINEARAKFDLPNIDNGDATLITPGAEKSDAAEQTKEGENSDGKSTE